MLTFTRALLLLTALSTASPVERSTSHSQHVLDLSDARSQKGNPRKLHGKFLHITDIHPDPFYKHGTDPDGDHPCHRGDGTAGYFGAEKTECDSPFSLVNATFDWIKHNLRDQIDFVIWTGDSARHDNDEKYPRTNKQVEYLNDFIVSKFDEVFGKPDNRHDPDPTNDFVVPIVPTYGNNDILPHNIFEPGPNKWTRKYLTIWEKFVPQEQRHSFARGGWFFTEVIPNRLAVFSLNTLYFFDSNAAVDGCDADTEPGYEHFEWLRIQLQFLRERKMKAILMGHVPPARTESKQNWDESCYQKYTLWLRQYRDVIITSIFGHMNLDHFTLQDVKELTYKFKIDGIDDEHLRDSGSSINHGFRTTAKPDYLSDLREHWSNLPKAPPGVTYTTTDVEIEKSKKKKKRRKKEKIRKFLQEIGGPYGERFSLSLISPSVVPNFFPTLRVIEYNITGLEHEHPALRPTAPLDSDLSRVDLDDESAFEYIEELFEDDLEPDELETMKKKKKHKKKKKGKKPKPNFPVPKPPSKSSTPGPGYSSQPLSLVSWTQLYANLTRINEGVARDLENLETSAHEESEDDLQDTAFKKHFTYEVEYGTGNDTVYSMKDLTMRSWLDYAEKIGRAKYDPEVSDVDGDLEQEALERTQRPDPSDEVARPDIDFEDLDDLDPNDGTIDPDCLAYFRRLKAAALAIWNPWYHDSKPSRFAIDFNVDPTSKCRQAIDIDLHQEDDESNKEDSGYDSDECTEESDDDDGALDSGYDDDENNDDENDENDDSDGLDMSKKRKKHKKHKKKKSGKRKGMSLKKNHLWHTFVRRAFVGTKSFEELKDEFG